MVRSLRNLFSKRTDILFSVLFLVFASFGISSLPLWVDELFTWYTSSQNKLSDVLRLAYFEDFHPPFYPIFMHFWIRAFGDSESSLRIPSLLATCVTVFFVLRYIHARFSKNVFLASGVVILLTPKLLYFSQEARNYGLAMLFFCVLLLCVDEVLQGNRLTESSFVFKFALFASLCVYTHYIFVFALFALFLSVILLCENRIKKQVFGFLVKAGLLAIVLVSPLLPQMLKMSGQGSYWVSRPNLTGGLQFVSLFIGSSGITAIMWFFIFVFLSLYVWRVRGFSIDSLQSESRFSFVCALTLIITFALITAKSFFGASLFLNRFLAPLFPCFFFMAPYLIKSIARSKTLGKALVILLCFAYSLQYLHYRFTLYPKSKEPTRLASRAATAILIKSPNLETVVMLSHPGLRYYLPKPYWPLIKVDSFRDNISNLLRDSKFLLKNKKGPLVYLFTNMHGFDQYPDIEADGLSFRTRSFSKLTGVVTIYVSGQTPDAAVPWL